MSYGYSTPGPPSLRAALATVHRDERWWAKCLLYGAAALTVVGLPLAAGFVMESLDNSRRGYPTPLPAGGDLSLRWLTGLFCLLIDFAFFVLPLLLAGMAILCASVGLVIAGQTGGAAAALAPPLVAALAGLWVAGVFLASAAPAGRLLFAREGRIEEALSGATLRWATAQPQRGIFLRARLASLPAYLPAVASGAVAVAILPLRFPGQALALAASLWLALAALVYAHLVVVQLFVAAEREAQRRALGM